MLVVFCALDGNTLLNLTPSLTVSYPVITATPRSACVALKWSRWVVMETGTGERFPTVTFLLWLDFYILYLSMGMLLPKCFLKSKLLQSCWYNGASCAVCVTPAGCQSRFSFIRILVLRQSATHAAGAGQGGCSGGRGCCCERSHFCKLFCRLCSSPAYKSCQRGGLMYRNVRLYQSRLVFLHSSILCYIWEESLNYSVSCITVCKSVYNQGLGFCPYLWMTRAWSGHSSSTDSVCELHNDCGYMTLLLHARPRAGWDIWQAVFPTWMSARTVRTATVQARQPSTLWSPSTDLVTISVFFSFWSFLELQAVPWVYPKPISSRNSNKENSYYVPWVLIVEFSFSLLLMAYGYNIFTVSDEMLDKVLPLAPQLLWLLMLNTHTSLETTLNGNPILAIIANSFCFRLHWRTGSLDVTLGEKNSKTAVCLFHSHLRALFRNVLLLH